MGEGRVIITTEDLAYFRLKIGESTMDECLELTKYLKGKLDEQELIILSSFGFKYLQDFVAMREERNAQLTDKRELLEYLQTQPALMQLLSDIMMTPSDVDHSPIRRTKMLRIIRAWRGRKV